MQRERRYKHQNDGERHDKETKMKGKREMIKNTDRGKENDDRSTRMTEKDMAKTKMKKRKREVIKKT